MERILDLEFRSGQEECDQRLEELVTVPLSWTDHYLVGFRFTWIPRLSRGGGFIKIICTRSQMDPNRFLMALGELPADMIGAIIYPSTQVIFRGPHLGAPTT